MQYPVPQFTDVEDRLIGPLTIRQFGIIFGAGVFVFLLFSATKNVAVLIISVLFVGLPALAFAFAKVNGRPLYRTFPMVLNFFTKPRLLVFHKETGGILESASQEAKAKADTIEPVAAPADPKARLREVNRLLQKQAAEERDIVKRIK